MGHPWQPGAHPYGSAVCLRCGTEWVPDTELPTARLLTARTERAEENTMEEPTIPTTQKQRFLVPPDFRGEEGVEPYRTAEKMAQDWIEEIEATLAPIQLSHKQITVLDHWLVEAEVKYNA